MGSGGVTQSRTPTIYIFKLLLRVYVILFTSLEKCFTMAKLNPVLSKNEKSDNRINYYRFECFHKQFTTQRNNPY